MVHVRSSAYPSAEVPALPAVPSTLRVRWIGTVSGAPPIGSHATFRYVGAAPTSAQLLAVAPAWSTAWNTNLAPLTDPGFTLTQLEIIDLSSSTGAVAEYVTSHAGTRVGAATPLNSCFTCDFLTPLRRRGGHWHVQQRVGTVQDLASEVAWTTAFVTAAVSGIQAFFAGITASLWAGATSMSQVGVQYYGPPNKTVTSSSGRVKTVSTQLAVPQVYPVTGFLGRSRVGSQRRRLG